MEKRLPHVIIISFLVIVLWTVAFPGPTPEDADSQDRSALNDAAQVGGAGEPAVEPQVDLFVEPEPAPQPSMGSLDFAPALVAADEVQELIIEVGLAGEVGHFRAVFSNLGAQLVDLRTGTYFRRVGLSDEERVDPVNWLRLIEAVDPLQPTSAMGAFALDGTVSGRDITPALLSEVIWESEVLIDTYGATRGIEFRYAGANGILFTKRIEQVSGSWDLGLTISITSPASLPEGINAGPRGFAMVAAGPIGVEIEDAFYKQPKAVAVGPAGGTDLDIEAEAADLGAGERRGSLDVVGPLAAVGGHNKYFAVLLRPADAEAQAALGSALWRRFDGYGPGDPDVGLDSEIALVAPEPYILAEVLMDLELPRAGNTSSWAFLLYAGPKDHDEFLEGSAAHAEVLDSDLHFFSGIGNLLIEFLVVLEGFTGNWGVAIILLTFCIRLILFPLNRRSQTAMARYQKKMKRVQPKLNEIKEKYKDDAQKLREAQARIMQEEGAFPPLGGCLPIFLQMPVFFGLFAALRTSFDLRHANFAGWIEDLSRPDQLFELGFTVPLLDWEYFNLLPILMVILWIWQQRTMPQPTDEQARRMQRIMLFMPVVMGVFLYNYAAGLSLYMMTQSGLGVFEQMVIKKLWPVDDTELAKKDKPGCAPLAGVMKRAAEQQKAQQARAQQSKPRKKRKR